MLLAEGLWSQRRKGRAHRRWREAKEHFDELVQMDGRFRPWLGQHGSKGCLMNMMDGATATWRGRPDAVWAEVRTPGDREMIAAHSAQAKGRWGATMARIRTGR